jgi:hypothetical protein
MERLSDYQAKQELDLSSDEFTERFNSATIYAKKIYVEAYKAAIGEIVRETRADGTDKIIGVTRLNDVVVSDIMGHKSITKIDVFSKHYEATSLDGIFHEKGMTRAFQNPTGSEIEVNVPWGIPGDDREVGDVDCMIATIYDPSLPDQIGELRYIIDKTEFDRIYAPLDELNETKTEKSSN